MGRGLLSERLKTAGLLLALFALTFKALLAPGYMLAPVQDRVVVAICSIDGAVAMPLPGGAPDQHQGDHKEHNGGSPCVFASVGAIDAPQPAPAPRAPVAVTAAIDWPPSFERTADDLAAPPPWPRGPPLSI
jgi:hypothetical protein